MNDYEYEYNEKMANQKHDLIDKVFEAYGIEKAEKYEDYIWNGKNNVLTLEDKVTIVSDFHEVYRFMPEEDRAIKQVAEIALLKEPGLYLMAPQNILEDREIAFNVATNGNIKYPDLAKFHDDFRSDPEIVLEIAKKDVEHATNYSKGLDHHFEKNHNEDKYDETCLKTLESEILANKLQDELSKKQDHKPKVKYKI